MSADPEKHKRSAEELLEEIEALENEVNEEFMLFKKILPAMNKLFISNKRKYSVKYWHTKYKDDLNDVSLFTFRDWWKSEIKKLEQEHSAA